MAEGGDPLSTRWGSRKTGGATWRWWDCVGGKERAGGESVGTWLHGKEHMQRLGAAACK